MDREPQQPPPSVDRARDAQFLDSVDSALDRHRLDSDPPPPSVHGTVIRTQIPTPDGNTGVGPPTIAHAGETKQDGLPRLISSAATPQFFGAGGPMCVVFEIAQILSDLSAQDASIRRVNTPKSQGV